MSDKPPDIPGGEQLRTIAMPRDTNAGDSIFGGWTLSQMDLAGGAPSLPKSPTDGIVNLTSAARPGAISCSTPVAIKTCEPAQSQQVMTEKCRNSFRDQLSWRCLLAPCYHSLHQRRLPIE